MCSMATLAARVHKSALEILPVSTYFSVIGLRRVRPTVGRPDGELKFTEVNNLRESSFVLK